MTKKKFIIVFFFLSQFSFSQTKIIHHSINANLNPLTSFIDLEDKVTLEQGSEKSILFELNSSLDIYFKSNNIKLKKLKTFENSVDIGMDRGDSGIKLNKWQLTFKDAQRNFTIKYRGKIESPLEQSMENYQRGFSESPGIISDTGIYLAGSTYWIPSFNDLYITFDLNVNLPSGWSSVSQGKRTIHKNSGQNHKDSWSSPEPQEEIFLIAARFVEYSSEMNDGVVSMAFLRTKDDALANKYLEVTEQYMAMYEEMIGKFPYSKFALVENFWETGYGMPSFTLLGEKIIRFPFILHSSYPHELLHNWWGNSVYVDFETGNWCEGLTAYLADHLIKEQRDQAAEYRRSTLQKYTDFVDDHNDFSLSKFASRHDASSEAIGYGKSLMFFHMLRKKIGDENFIKGLRDFYTINKYKQASFRDIKKSMERFTDIDLSEFFSTWIEKTGAPKMLLTKAELTQNQQLKCEIQQIQKSFIYDLDIPVYISTSQGIQKETISMKEAVTNVVFDIKGKPIKLEVDPYYDLFRVLDPDEVPPALSKIMASKENLIILPFKTEKKEIYKEFAEKWINSDNGKYKIVYDNEISKIPELETSWILGKENKFFYLIDDQLNAYDDALPAELRTLNSENKNHNSRETVVTVFEPKNNKKQLIFIDLSNHNAIDGLIRKLPHYGKYSYLGFEGDEPVNVLKGQWEVINSPLTKIFDNKSLVQSPSEKRNALGELKPIFSKKRMKEHVEYLASEEMKGRGLGTPELDTAANYIADLFMQYGLQPLKESYYQEFNHDFENKGRFNLKNVIGIIKGSDLKLSDYPVVLSAHYDHLGMGWPDVRAGNEGKIHFGADDNASGVAVLLELAKSMGKSLKPKRTIIFVAFTGEEAGLTGSRYFVNNFDSLFNGKVFANVNLDSDGRLFNKKLLILNANTAKEWKFIFMGTDYTTGVSSEIVEKDLDASDQKAFIENGIPAVQLFAGPNEDYHRPTDTSDKIDYEGMVKIASVVKEVIEYLGDREEDMTFTGTQDSNQGTAVANKKRSASTGAMPDFSYNGNGMKIGVIASGSAGEKAGLMKGDIIIGLNETEIENLKQYSEELKKFSPGEEVLLTINRDEEILKINIKLGSR